MDATPGGTYTSFAPIGATGIAATAGFTLYNADGTVAVTRVVGTGITEIGTSGWYRKTTTAPATPGTYFIQWDDGATTIGHTLGEELVVAPAVDFASVAADVAAIMARLAHIGAAVIAPIDPVNAAGDTVIYKGDSYLAAFGRQLIYSIPGAIDLTLADTVTWRVEGQTPDLAVAMTVIDENTCWVELHSAQTALLAPTSNSPLTFEIDALLTTGETSTVKRASLAVLPDLAA